MPRSLVNVDVSDWVAVAAVMYREWRLLKLALIVRELMALPTHVAAVERRKWTKLMCPECDQVLTNAMDIANGYCFRCHWWTLDPELGPARRAELDSRREA